MLMGCNPFQQLTVRAADSRKRKEDDQKKLDLAKQLELVSIICWNTKKKMLAWRIFSWNID